MTSRHARMRNSGLQGNGRTPAENHEITRVARLSQDRATELANAAAGRAGRREKLRQFVIERDGQLPPALLEKKIDDEIIRQMAAARAAKLIKARHAAAEQAKNELLDGAR